MNPLLYRKEKLFDSFCRIVVYVLDEKLPQELSFLLLGILAVCDIPDCVLQFTNVICYMACANGFNWFDEEPPRCPVLLYVVEVVDDWAVHVQKVVNGSGVVRNDTVGNCK